MLIAQGGAYGGWSFYADDGRLALRLQPARHRDRHRALGRRGARPGEHELRAHFAYDGGGLGKGGTVTLLRRRRAVGEGRVERTLPFQFTFDETVDVGCDLASPVSPDYGATGNEFTGTIDWVRIDLGDDDHSPPHRRRAQVPRRDAQAVAEGDEPGETLRHRLSHGQR